MTAEQILDRIYGRACMMRQRNLENKVIDMVQLEIVNEIVELCSMTATHIPEKVVFGKWDTI